MKVSYDPEVDTMYISFSDGERITQQEINANIHLDLAADGTVVGMELLAATSTYGRNVLEFSLSFLGDKLLSPGRTTYTADEAAHILRVNKETILRKIRVGEIQAFRLGKLYQIPKTELSKLMHI